jgi:Flp pilus assembly protein TadD
MQRLIILLSCVLFATLTWGNLALAQSSETLSEQGQRLAEAGDIKGALATFEQLAQSQPDSHEAYVSLGGMQLLDQRYSDAVRSFQRAISLGDQGTGSFIGMGMAYLHMGQLGPARAAFIEAKTRGTDGTADIDQIIAWIDTRDSGEGMKMH